MRFVAQYLTFAVFIGFTAALTGQELHSPDRSIETAIDHYVEAKLQDAGVSPAPQADDANFLRRIMLDLVGRIPTAAEARAFLTSADMDKRISLVDRLTASPAFVRQQAAEFDALLMRDTKASLRDYLTKAWGERRTWDTMFREMIVGEEGDGKQTGAIQFVRARAKDQDRLTTDASVLFFGVNVSCAKCHDHPLVDDWKQEHYFGLKSFFARTFDLGEFVGERDYGTVTYKTVDGQSHDARLMFLSGEIIAEPANVEPDESGKAEEKRRLEELKKKKEPPPAPAYSRRARLVEAALQPQSRALFSRAIVNHLWNRLLGRGLVMPVDQMHSANPPSHPELLDWLARDLESHNYDLNRLIRGIVLSRAYARSSRWDSASPRPAENLFAVAVVRPLTPWQYGTSLCLAATSPDQFPFDMSADDAEQRIQRIEGSGRALGNSLELPGESFQVSADEALLFSNSGRIMKDLLSDGAGTLLDKLQNSADRHDAVELAVWNIMGRPPADEELQALEAFLAQRHDRPGAAYRQMVWALLTSSECRFNY